MVALTLFGVIYLLPVDDNKYLAVTIDKHRILAETKQPRIIFVGDSNLAFGLDSRMVKEKTGYNVVNMGLHGGLGIIYYMDELKPYLKKGDIIIFIFDYQNYLFDGTGSNPLIEISIFNPSVLQYYSRENVVKYFKSIPITFQRRMYGFIASAKDDPAYSRSGFNEFGDNEGHLGLVKKLRTAERKIPEEVPEVIVKIFNEFHETWSPKGVDIYLSFSPLIEENKEDQLKSLNKLREHMRKSLKLTIIGKPGPFVYPKEYFYDNPFHLNAEGRKVRTGELIKAMKGFEKFARPPKKD
jgi:hypothetical protein